VYTPGSTPLSLATIVVLLYADDMVLFNTNVGKLVEMLKVVDFWASEMAMRINVTKTNTKIMLVGRGAPQLLVNTPICSGSMQLVESFKYLGGIVNSQVSLQEEVDTHRAHGLGAFAQFSHVWGNRHLSVQTKVKFFNFFIILHFVYDNEMWPLTRARGDRLETAYNSYLKRILGVGIVDHHSLEHMRGKCQVPSLRWFLAQRRLSWLRHMARMLEERYPCQVLFSCLRGAKHSRGHLCPILCLHSVQGPSGS